MRLSMVAIFLAITLPLCSCGLGSCIDSAFPRATQKLATHTIELQYENQQSIHLTFSCERYYDAQCSERGNQWSVRETGAKFANLGSFIELHDPRYGKVEIPRPTCGASTSYPENYRMARVNGLLYKLAENNGNTYVYVIEKFQPPGRLKTEGPPTVSMSYILKFDGIKTHPYS